MEKMMIALTAALALTAAQPAIAGGDHNMKDHGQMHGAMHGDNNHAEAMKDQGKMKNMLLVKKEIDGYTVSFHAMKAKPGKEMGGSHDFMIKVEKDGAIVTGLTANSKVLHPNGKSESKMMMKMGDWYMAGYDMDHDGQHQLMVLFKTVDGEKHFGGVNYPKENH